LEVILTTNDRTKFSEVSSVRKKKFRKSLF
jgi:hypothetical protein